MCNIIRKEWNTQTEQDATEINNIIATKPTIIFFPYSIGWIYFFLHSSNWIHQMPFPHKHASSTSSSTAKPPNINPLVLLLPRLSPVRHQHADTSVPPWWQVGSPHHAAPLKSIRGDEDDCGGGRREPVGRREDLLAAAAAEAVTLASRRGLLLPAWSHRGQDMGHSHPSVSRNSTVGSHLG